MISRERERVEVEKSPKRPRPHRISIARREERKKRTSLGAWSDARVISFLRGGPFGRGGPLMTSLSPKSTAETTPGEGGRESRWMGEEKKRNVGRSKGEFLRCLSGYSALLPDINQRRQATLRTLEPRSHHVNVGGKGRRRKEKKRKEKRKVVEKKVVGSKRKR